jgi:pSer/pThr/pTyr-binding forkhead associated (FHA) protein
MDSRTPSEIEATGTLPLGGEGSVPVTPEAAKSSPAPDWVQEARANVTGPGRYLAYEDSGHRVVVPVAREWTRIGRSLSADVRFDDATVSRRHALVACQDDAVRVLDDRSLNGVFVNGRRVDFSPLTDGDQIAIGRHTLYYIDTSTVGAAAPAVPAALAE